MLINVRGAFGAGKSTIVRNVLGKPNLGQNANRVVLAETIVVSESKPGKVSERKRQIKGTLGHFGHVCALGTYRAENPCGGVDEFSWKGAHDTICEAIAYSAGAYPVTLFEGQVISGIFQRYVNLAKRCYDITGQPTHVVYVMPGREECLRRVSARSGKPIDDERLISSVYDKYKAVEGCYQKMKALGAEYLVLHYETSTDKAEEAVAKLVWEELEKFK